MRFFLKTRSKSDEQLIRLLRTAQQDFHFPIGSIKHRLMQSIGQAMPVAVIESKFRGIIMLRYSVVAAGVIVIISGGLVLASTNSTPGDALFPIAKLREQVILGLTFDDLARADYRADIVSDRLQALDQINQNVEAPQAKINNQRLQVVAESDKSLSTAVDAVMAQQESLQNQGKEAQAAKLRQTLVELDQLALQHEEKIEALESETDDAQTQASIEEHLLNIRHTHAKTLDWLNQPLPLAQ